MIAWRLAAFASPVAPLTIAFLPLVLLIPGFYVQEMGLGVAAVGGALVFSRLVDAVADPLVGILCDRTASRFGRRRPWIVLGTPLLLLGVWLLYAPPGRPGIAGLYASLSLVYVGWTCVFIPLQAWGAELPSRDTQPEGERDRDRDRDRDRSRLNVYMGFVNGIGTLLCLALPFLVLGPQSAVLRRRILAGLLHAGMPLPASLARILDYPGTGKVPFAAIMQLLATLIAVLLPLTVALCLFANRERPAPAARSRWMAAFTLFGRNPPFTRLVLGNLCLQVGLQLWTAAQAFYLIAVLGIPDALLLLLVVNQGFALLTVPAWAALVRRIGRARGLASSGLLMIAGLGLLLVAPSGSMRAVIPAFLLFGAASVGKWMLPIALAADATDYDESRNGRREAGLHLSMLYFTSKLGIAAGGAMLVLFGLVGFDPASHTNPPSTLLLVRCLGTLLPACCSALGAAILWNLPLGAGTRAADQPAAASVASQVAE